MGLQAFESEKAENTGKSKVIGGIRERPIKRKGEEEAPSVGEQSFQEYINT